MHLLTVYEIIAERYCLLKNEHAHWREVQHLLAARSCFCYSDQWAKVPRSQRGPLSDWCCPPTFQSRVAIRNRPLIGRLDDRRDPSKKHPSCPSGAAESRRHCHDTGRVFVFGWRRRSCRGTGFTQRSSQIYSALTVQVLSRNTYPNTWMAV